MREIKEQKKKVIVFGIFDGIHDGHRSLFRQAKEHGEELIVIVGRDSASLRLKGKRPKYPEETRRNLVSKEKDVDMAVLGDEEQSSYKVLEEVNPNVICLGYDQENLAEDLEKWMKEKGRQISVYVLRLYKSDNFHNSFLSYYVL